jgi:hypothetical protein
MADQRVPEDDSVLTLNDEASNVKRTKLDPCIRVRRIIARSRKMVQSSRDIYHKVTIHQDLELANAIIEVVKIESRESQLNSRPNRLGHRQRERTRTRRVRRIATVRTSYRMDPSPNSGRRIDDRTRSNTDHSTG